MRLFSLFVVSALLLPGSLIAEDEKKPAKKPLSAAEKAAVAEIRKSGGQVLEVAQNDSRLDIAFHLSDKDVKDETIAPLSKLSNVYSLNLRGTKVTNAGLKSIAGIKSLVRLHLEKTAVTDPGLAHVKGLANLEYLNLYGTNVTDAGLESLYGLKKLKKVFLWQTKVTDDGVKKLQAAIPKLKIIRGGAAKKTTPAKKTDAKKPAPKKK